MAMLMSLFDEHKAAEATAFFLSRNAGPISHPRLSSLLYLSERASFKEYAAPITGDLLAAIDSGPVLLRLHGFFVGSTQANASPVLGTWLARGPRSGFQIRAKREWRDSEFGLSHLSEADREILERSWAEYGGMNRGDLTDYTKHNCPEWSDPSGAVKHISYASLLRHLGYPPDVAEGIVAELNEQARFNQALAA
jgi:hypothetical protein